MLEILAELVKQDYSSDMINSEIVRAHPWAAGIKRGNHYSAGGHLSVGYHI